MIPPARRMALDILHRCLDQNQDVQAAVDAGLKDSTNPKDNGLATELVYGYLRMRGRLDFLLDTLLRQPGKTSAGIRRILGLAAQEILFLDSIPDYATLDWSVSLVRKRFGQLPAKVANGVLRSLLRLGAAVQDMSYFRQYAKNRDAANAAWYSCPAWLMTMWTEHYGQETAQALLQTTLHAPVHGIRVHPHHPDKASLLERLAPLALHHSHAGFALSGWPEFLHQALTDGVASRQSMAAQEIIMDLHPQSWPEPILDACAGRGGKTYQLAELGKQVWASDINMFRLRQILAEGRRLHCSVPAFRAPGQGPYPLAITPRTILLDAPCSGLGVLSRRPDIKWKRSLADCRQLSQLQMNLMQAAAAILPTGGLLAYVTCTLNAEENERQIARFLSTHSEFSLLEQKQTAIDSGLGEFFFGATLRKS